MTTTVVDADELCARINAVWGHTWTVWQAAGGHWCVALDRQTLTAESLSGVLTVAAAYPKIPVIPARPLPHQYAIEPRPFGGGRWWVTIDGSPGYSATTKKAAEQTVADAYARDAKAVDEWDTLYGRLVAGGTEGVDYRFAR